MFRAKRAGNFVKFLRTFGQVFGGLSIQTDSSKCKRTFFDILYWIYFINEIHGALATINGLLCCFTTVNDLLKSCVEIIFRFETTFNLNYQRHRSRQFEHLTDEMEYYFEVTSPEDLNQPKLVCRFLIVLFTVGAVLFIFAPLGTENQLTPLNTVYFMVPREKYWGLSVTYALNVLHILNATSVMLLDLLIILIMWHVACKFTMLGRELTILNDEKLKEWIKRHKAMISYADEINSIVAPLAIKSTIIIGVCTISSGLAVVNNLDFIQLMKFFIVSMFSMVRFLACSWAADKMTEKAFGVAWEIYNSPWVYLSPSMRRKVILIIQRCQRPVTVHVAGFLSAWSLSFCGQVLYTILTYFLTLRAVLRRRADFKAQQGV